MPYVINEPAAIAFVERVLGRKLDDDERAYVRERVSGNDAKVTGPLRPSDGRVARIWLKGVARDVADRRQATDDHL